MCDASGHAPEFHQPTYAQYWEDLVSKGALIPRHTLLARTGWTSVELDRRLLRRQAFRNVVGKTDYFLAPFASEGIERARLAALCQVLAPLPPTDKLDVLLTRWGSLGGRCPIDMLSSFEDYRAARRNIRSRVDETCRTCLEVQVRESSDNAEARTTSDFTACCELDPRASPWHRAAIALQYQRESELGANAVGRRFTLTLTEHQSGADSPVVLQTVAAQISTRSVRYQASFHDASPMPTDGEVEFSGEPTVRDVVVKIVDSLRAREPLYRRAVVRSCNQWTD